MYRNFCPQKGRFTLFFSSGAKPLKIWDVHLQNGYVTRFLDPDLRSNVVEIRGSNVSTSFIVCPKEKKSLGIPFPFLVMILKNIKQYFTFEITVLDETNTRRRFRASNFQSTTQSCSFYTAMPLCLADGWNQVQCDLSEFTKRAYNKVYIEAVRLQINANVRLRRIYFASRLDLDNDLAPDNKLFYPIEKAVDRCICQNVDKSGNRTTKIHNCSSSSEPKTHAMKGKSRKWESLEKSEKSNENKHVLPVQSCWSETKSKRTMWPFESRSSKIIQTTSSTKTQNSGTHRKGNNISSISKYA